MLSSRKLLRLGKSSQAMRHFKNMEKIRARLGSFPNFHHHFFSLSLFCASPSFSAHYSCLYCCFQKQQLMEQQCAERSLERKLSATASKSPTAWHPYLARRRKLDHFPSFMRYDVAEYYEGTSRTTIIKLIGSYCHLWEDLTCGNP